MTRDIKAQYKQSLLGYAWILLNPIAHMAILSFVFATALRAAPSNTTNFPLFLSVGLLPWIYFTNAVNSGTVSVANSPNVIKSIYFPREMLVIAATLVRLVDLGAGLLIVGVLIVVSGQSITWTVAWMPLLILIHVIFTIGVSLPLAALQLFFRDVRFVVTTGLGLLFFLTPIFYSPSAVPDRYRFIYDLNPSSRLIQAYRYALFDGVSPPIDSVLWAAGLSLIALVGGYYVFKKMEPYFADYV